MSNDNKDKRELEPIDLSENMTERDESMPKALTAAKRSQKMTKFEIDGRRRQVQKLRMRGMTVETISKLLKVSVGTVQRDLDAIAEENRKQLEGFTPEDYLAEDSAFYDDLLELGFQEFLAAKAGTPHRLRALDFLKNTRSERRQAYKDCGLIQDQSINVNHEIEYKLPWDTETQRMIAETLLQRSLTAPSIEPQPDYIEAEIVDAQNVATTDVDTSESGGENGES